MTDVLITGNTYPVKDQLKALGAKWDADAKGWRVPTDKADQAQAIVATGPGANAPKKEFVHYKCKCCGAKAWNGRRGRYSNGGTVIYRSGECRDCYEERKMGY